MERQKSFSFKHTRLLVFSFTISSSLLFCFLFSFWVLKNTPSSFTETHLQFSASLGSTKAQAFTAPSSNLSVSGAKNPILAETHLREATDFSGEVLASSKNRRDATSADVQLRETAYSSLESADSVRNRKNAIFSYTHFRKTSKSSEESVDLVGEKKITNLTDARFRKSDDFSSVMRVEANNSESDASKIRKERFGANSMAGNESFYNASVQSTALDAGKIESEGASTCDVSDGRWVFDESYPLYTSNSCPFIDEGFSCQANGRLDRDYLKWRWQPHGCNIPRFNPVKVLELIRGKRLVFVGDSINRNQWESMLCLLRGGISDPSRMYEARRRRITKEKGHYNFKFMDYHCSVEYYVTHFLVHESKARVGQKRVKTLRIDTIDRSSSRWKGADILVFNTAHWWSHYKTKAGLNYYQEGDQVHPRLDVSTAFRRALIAWASWVDQHLTPGKTQVFFRSSAPSHFRGGEWNSGGHCKESTQPLNDTSSGHYPERDMIVEQVIKQMKTPVTILNITNLSGLRIDGHPSIYGRKQGKGSPSSIQDCSHWCLPGVPDTWNELLYFYLLSTQKPDFTN